MTYSYFHSIFQIVWLISASKRRRRTWSARTSYAEKLVMIPDWSCKKLQSFQIISTWKWQWFENLSMQKWKCWVCFCRMECTFNWLQSESIETFEWLLSENVATFRKTQSWNIATVPATTSMRISEFYRIEADISQKNNIHLFDTV
jgi:hypothetical protein